VQYKNIIRILGLLVALLSVTMLPPALISLVYRDGAGLPFTLAFLWCIFTGFFGLVP
jgi:trk system potassium uptake protein TrkH